MMSVELKKDTDISHYKILEKIGAGGMGVVYKALDTKLDRNVALKFLPAQLSINQEEKKRFIHEAKAAAALDHPNICSIFEIDETKDGQMFIAMGYYEGETLQDKISERPLPIDEAIKISIQIAEGLNKAHAKNIVHRDIKAANIMVTEEGVVKILDFGLAKLRGVTKLTREGTTLGTVAYMSPEQTEGGKVDYRSDIWSLGVVLYEMLTGQLPFKGEYEQAIMYSIMNEDPEPVTALRTGLPLELERIINKTLAKNPGERYQGMAELLVDLKQDLEKMKEVPVFKGRVIKPKPGLNLKRILIPGLILAFVVAAYFIGKNFMPSKKTPVIKSIAVLPLENLSKDPEQEYFSAGMTDELIATLGKINSLRVTSRQSVIRYKKTTKSMPQIAEELDVNFLVEGTVLRSGQRVRITVQLIEGKTDRHTWAESYTGNLQDVFKLQSEVARSIAREIEIALTAEEKSRVERTRPVNPRAYELYLLGRYHYYLFTDDGWEKAERYYQEAIKVDPTEARAFAGLSSLYILYLFYDKIPRDEAYPKIKKLIKRAFEIDDTLPEAYQARAANKYYYEWDWDGAERDFKRALELNASLVGNNEYAWFLVNSGRFEEAVREARRTLHLDPYTYFSNATLAWVYFIARRYKESLAQWQKILKLGLNNVLTLRWLAEFNAYTGQYEKAVEAAQQRMKLLRASADEIRSPEEAYRQAGPEGYWQWRLKIANTPLEKARVLARLGQLNQAVTILEKLYEKRNPNILACVFDPRMDPLRDNPRFQNLIKMIKFPKSRPPGVKNKQVK